uniref:Solute carrier family 15 member 1 n=1 Tax=Lates calcarifer TaxID=8187 RepID=A0A4W6G4T3_LATCA
CTDKEDPKNGKMVVCGYPLSIFFIVVNEFCERFSYYGMRAVLVLYFKYFLRWDDDLATSIYHTFVALCYLTPILGAIVADSWLGKFKTIIYLSIVYAVGQVAMAVSAIHDITDSDRDGTPDSMTFHIVLSMVGLFLIALGTGGIKPCVAAFGGDQFGEHQDRQRRTFFSVFYLCINGGSLLSTIITPVLRAQECGIYSKQKCYSLAFGVPAALMVVALVVFIIGSGMYYKAEPQGNIMLDVCKCIGFAIKNRYRHRSKQYPKRQHWMDWAEEKYDVRFNLFSFLKCLNILLIMLLQWTLQATTMDGNFGALVIQPDQMQTVNPILILTLVPIMDSLIYPLIKKCGLNFTPLKRMTVGMLLAAIAFVCAALVQIQIDKTLPTFPSTSQSQLKLLNMGSNSVTVKLPGNDALILPAAQVYPFINNCNTKFTNLLPEVILFKSAACTITFVGFTDYFLVYFRFVNGMKTAVNVSTAAADFGLIEPFYYSNYSQIKNGKATFTLRSGSQSCEYSTNFGFGSSYTFFIHSTLVFGSNDSVTAVEDIKPNSVHMALQIPQYFFITAGEVMFSVTGLEFSYSQAPSNMKAVLQAGWLFTVAIGNFIVLIVAELAKIPKQWAEYVLFASLLVAVCVIFSIMAYFYTYIDPTEIEAQFKKKINEDDEDDKSKPGKAEVEMVKRDSIKCHDEYDKATQTKM